LVRANLVSAKGQVDRPEVLGQSAIKCLQSHRATSDAGGAFKVDGRPRRVLGRTAAPPEWAYRLVGRH
jgi:hypothetical protein